MIHSSNAGSDNDPFSNTCSVEFIEGDCREVVPTLGKFKSIFADPPFNIGQDYVGYSDHRDDCPEFTAQWVATRWDACDGIMALHGPDDLVQHYLRAEHELRMHRIAWGRPFPRCRTQHPQRAANQSDKHVTPTPAAHPLVGRVEF